MGNENVGYEKGYAEAVAVFEAAVHPGYCRDHEQSIRIARKMLKAGLTGKEAQSQRAAFIAADQRGNQDGVQTQSVSTYGTGAFIKPSTHSEGESLQAIFDRRKIEATAAPTNTTGGTIQKIYFDGMEAGGR